MVAQGKFDLNQQNLHINTKEVLTAYYAVQSFAPYLKGNRLLLRCDNTTAVANIRDMGTMLSPIRDSVCRKLWRTLYEQDCWLSINFIRGVQNWRADLASRYFNSRPKWAMPKPTFLKLAQLFRCPSMDLFASRLNKKLNRYVSWTPDPFCIEVDAFYFDLSAEFPYIYPPFNLLNRCLAKLQEDEVHRALVMFPLWPNQPWFPQLLELLISHIYVLPKNPPVYLPWKDHDQQTSFHNTCNLATALLSADPAMQLDYHHTLAPSSTLEFENRLKPIMITSLKHGLNFVMNGKEIPTLHL